MRQKTDARLKLYHLKCFFLNLCYNFNIRDLPAKTWTQHTLLITGIVSMQLGSWKAGVPASSHIGKFDERKIVLHSSNLILRLHVTYMPTYLRSIVSYYKCVRSHNTAATSSAPCEPIKLHLSDIMMPKKKRRVSKTVLG